MAESRSQADGIDAVVQRPSSCMGSQSQTRDPAIVELARCLADAAGHPAAPAKGHPPEGLRAADAAAYMGVSYSQWMELDRSARCPAAANLGERLPVWSRTELLCWLLAGAPGRQEWTSQRGRALAERTSLRVAG